MSLDSENNNKTVSDSICIFKYTSVFKKSKKFCISLEYNHLDSLSPKKFFNFSKNLKNLIQVPVDLNLNFLIFLIFLCKKIIQIYICILIFYNLNNKIKKLKKLKNHENKEKKINLICFDFLKKEKNFSRQRETDCCILGHFGCKTF